LFKAPKILVYCVQLVIAVGVVGPRSAVPRKAADVTPVLAVMLVVNVDSDTYTPGRSYAMITPIDN
jgi:hypothetical protein